MDIVLNYFSPTMFFLDFIIKCMCKKNSLIQFHSPLLPDSLLISCLKLLRCFSSLFLYYYVFLNKFNCNNFLLFRGQKVNYRLFSITSFRVLQRPIITLSSYPLNAYIFVNTKIDTESIY